MIDVGPYARRAARFMSRPEWPPCQALARQEMTQYRLAVALDLIARPIRDVSEAIAETVEAVASPIEASWSAIKATLRRKKRGKTP